MSKSRLLLLVIQLLPSILVFAQSSKRVSYINSQQGLSNNSVKCIYQDKKGFIWFGTYDGLNRYDGYEFTIFRNRIHDTTSLPHNYIYALEEDQQGQLWVGTGQGLALFNPAVETFSPVYFISHDVATPQKVLNNVTDIEADQKGNVFVGTNGRGLLVKAKDKQELVAVPLQKNTKVNAYYNLQAIAIDHQQEVWMIAYPHGLYKYNYKTSQLNLVNEALKDFFINQMVADGKGNLWLASANGLIQYSTIENKVVQILSAQSAKLSGNNISAILIDKKNKRLWLSIDGGGVNVLNLNTLQIEFMFHAAGRNSLSSESAISLLEDRESRIWIGTIKGGINLIDAAKERFNSVAHDPNDPSALSNNFVTAFYEDADRSVWVGTDGGGVNLWNPGRSAFRKFKHQQNNTASLSSNAITSICKDYTGMIWIATFGGGINRLLPGTDQFERYKCINTRTGKENSIILRLYEDKQKNLWAGGFENGSLYKFNRQSNKFEIFNPSIGDVITIYEDRLGNLWTGNSNRLLVVDRNTRQYKSYEIGKPVRAIYEDSKNRFWIGTEGAGLILFNREKKIIEKQFSETEGLSNNAVFTILEDNAGSLWMSTYNGLTSFDPEKNLFRNFYQSDGLQSNQFSYRGAAKLHTGELLFGGNAGFDIFHPDKVSVQNRMPALAITGLRIDNKPVSVNQEYIFSDSGEIKKMRLPYDAATLTVQFAALEYSSPDKIQYAYYLDGWDKDWNYSGKNRSVTYNNIREGNYQLRIKSTNAEGVWNTSEKVMSVVVLPPWYRSVAAYFIYALLIGAAFYLYQRFKVSRAKLKFEMHLARLNEERKIAELEREKIERKQEHTQHELTKVEFERQKAEREIERVITGREKEINEKRLSFFTNISHEFRTPLTLIINPLQDVLRRIDGKDKEDLSTVNRNAKRLLNLTDQLLMFRKVEEGGEGLKVTRFDFTRLVADVFSYFKYEAKLKKIEYSLNIDTEVIDFFADRNQIEIILYNLLSNAFKYSPENGCIQVEVKSCPDTVKVMIRDSGDGIPSNVGNKIFDRFYQAPGHAKAGFGIGLYMAKQFVDQHSGSIGYQSKEGEGTTFELTLLKGRQHFKETPVLTDVAEVVDDEYAPASENEEIKTDDEAPIPFIPVISSRRAILIVDDDDEIRKYIRQSFNEQYIIYEANNGLDGLKLALEKLPDLIISDVMMPNMTGIELCQKIKDDDATNHLPVILLTAIASQEVELQGTEQGADYYITKPFNKDILIARVKSIFNNRDRLHGYFYDKVTNKPQQKTIDNNKVPVEYQEILDRCIAIVEKHLDDAEFTIQKLAKEMGMSHSSLYRHIKLISGQSVNSFIRFLRLRKAAELLISSNDNVNEVVYKVGFNDLKYFREQFAKLFNMSPTEYIKKYRNSFGDKLRVER